MIIFPEIDPVIFSIGFVEIRWYALAYVAGILLSWGFVGLVDKEPKAFNKKAYDDFIVWAILGVMLGGRIGYVLFYNFDYYLSNPLDALKIWQGGMSFHGGLIGAGFSMYLMCRKFDLKFLRVIDLVSCAAPIGLFFGRIANFINAELWGRYSDQDFAFGVLFPSHDYPRHPSQLYEAALEGLILFFIMVFALKKTKLRSKSGALTGLFLIGYGSFRAFIELFREPDAHIGYLMGFITTGQLLCLPMIIGGIYLMRSKCSNKK